MDMLSSPLAPHPGPFNWFHPPPTFFFLLFPTLFPIFIHLAPAISPSSSFLFHFYVTTTRSHRSRLLTRSHRSRLLTRSHRSRLLRKLNIFKEGSTLNCHNALAYNHFSLNKIVICKIFINICWELGTFGSLCPSPLSWLRVRLIILQ